VRKASDDYAHELGGPPHQGTYAKQYGNISHTISPNIYSAHPSAKPSPLRLSGRHAPLSPATDSSKESSLGPIASREINKILSPHPYTQSQSLHKEDCSPKEQSRCRGHSPTREQSPHREQSRSSEPQYSPPTAFKAQKWLPTSYSKPFNDSSPPNSPIIQGTVPTLHATPITAVRTSISTPGDHSDPVSPTSHHIPFLREVEYPNYLPPKTPPKSALQLRAAQSARENMKKLEAENAELKRQYSQLQDAVNAQGRTFVRENSRLQEQMLHLTQQVPQTHTPHSAGGGVLRRLSKLGSRSTKSSPKKSPSKH
jgi:hypothetical protein